MSYPFQNSFFYQSNSRHKMSKSKSNISPSQDSTLEKNTNKINKTNFKKIINGRMP